METATMPKSKIRQHSERELPEGAPQILKEGLVAHIGFVDDGWPVVIPFSYYYDISRPDRLYIHGSPGSRALHVLQNGAPVCIEVTITEGLVYSRNAKYHSMNYRSAICFGRSRAITSNEEKERLFEEAVLRYFPGRTAGKDYAGPDAAQLQSTLLLEILIEQWSAKARSGGPKGPDDARPDAPGTCGVLPVTSL